MSTQDNFHSLISPVKGRIKASLTPTGYDLALWEHLDEASQFPLGSVKRMAQGLVEHNKFYKGSAKNSKEFAAVQAQLGVVLNSLGQEIKWSYHETESTRNICGSLLEEINRLPGKRDQNNPQQSIEDVSELDLVNSDVLECYRRIRDHLKRLSLDMASWEIEDDGWRTEDRMAKLAPTPGNSVDVRNLFRALRARRTWVDALAQILSWTNTAPTGSIYWITGTPGTGKTTMAHSLCEDLKSRFALGASCFCSQSAPDGQNTNLVIPSIARQLANFSRPYWLALDLELQNDPNLSIHRLRPLILNPFKKVQKALPTNLVVVIDALEECEDKELVLQLLLSGQAAEQAKLPVKFIVFTRPTPLMRHRLEGLNTNALSHLVMHNLDNGGVEADIESYLKKTLAPITSSPSDIATIVHRADNSFTYAAKATQYVDSSQNTHLARERFNALLGAQPLPLSPHHIDGLYSLILQGLFEQPKLEANLVTNIWHTLHTIAFSKELLTSKTIAGLLGIDHDEVVFALNFLQPVVHVLKHDGLAIPLLESSFSGYLLDPNRSKPCYWDSNNFLTHRCFDLIRDAKPRFNICGLGSSYNIDADILCLGKQTEHSITPTMVYACQHWSFHMNASADIRNLEIRLKEFLSNHLFVWLEVLNLTKNTKEIPAIIDMAEQWAKWRVASSETIQLAEAASFFATTFATNPVSQSTPHMYLSSLPALPLFNPIRRLYGRQIRGGFQITGSAFAPMSVLMAKGETGGQVYSATFAPDGTIIALGAGNDVQVVDALSGRQMLEPLKGHTWSVMSVAFSSDGSRIASGSRDKTIRVWNSQTGELVVGPLLGHTGHIRSVVFSPSGSYIISGSNDTTIRVWDVATGVLKLGPLSGHTDYVKSIAIFSDEARIASGSKDGTIRIWDLHTGDLLLAPLRGHVDYVTSISLSPDGTCIASGSADRTICMWDSQSGQLLLAPFTGHKDWVLSVAFTPDGDYLISGSSDRTIRIWVAATGELAAEPFFGHSSHIYSVACSLNGAHFVSGSGDETFCLWKTRITYTEPLALPGHSQAIKSVHISPNGRNLVSGSSDQSICVWDLDTNTMILGPLVGHTGAVNSVCFSNDGSVIVSASDDGSVRIWNVKTGILEASFEPPNGQASRVNSVSCASKSPSVVSGASNGILCIWSYKTGELLLGPLKLHNEAVQIQTAKFSPDDSRIATGSTDRTIYVVDTRTGAVLLGPLLGHTGGIRSVGFSPDGSKIISGSDDKTIRLWDAQTGQFIQFMRDTRLFSETHIGPVLSVQFSPDGTLIASGSGDHTICVWDSQSGSVVLGPLRGHTTSVNSVAFFPDGTHLASASSDMAIRVWDIRPQLLRLDSDTSIWTMNEEGWVAELKESQDKEQGRTRRYLAWLNPQLRASLMVPRNIALFSRGGYVKLNFEDARIGKLWTEIYRPM